MSVSNIHSSGYPADMRANDSARDLIQSNRHSPQGPERGDSAKGPSLEENRQRAFQVIEQTLQMGYEKLAAKRGGSAGQFAQFEPLSAEKVAGNILGFIEQRLQSDAADGATQEQLQERLEQGLAGFKKGFAEAQKQLEALSRFTPEIQTDINDTRDRVLSGIEGLRERILDDAFNPEKSGNDKGREASAEKGNSVEAEQSVRPTAYAYEQARASAFSFELTTAEGDVVSIQANSSGAASLSGGGQGQSFSASASRSTSWSVEGDLNDDERAAIESVLGQVDSLSEQFFSGDLDGAMTSAMDLGFEGDQIAQFSLNLSQTDIRRVSESYGQVSRADGQPSGASTLQERLAPLGQFLRDLEATLAESEKVSAQPQQLLLDAGERMAAGNTGENVDEAGSLRQFMARMLETLSTDASTQSAQTGRADAGDDASDATGMNANRNSEA